MHMVNKRVVGISTALLIGALTPAAPGQLALDSETILADGMWNSPSSCAVDGSGVVHIAFMTEFDIDSSTKEIVYATNAGGSFSFTPITSNAVLEEFPDLTLDAAGNVHIAMHTGTGVGDKIRYTNNVSGSFFTPVDITDIDYVRVEHAVDSSGTAFFVFQTRVLFPDIYYATRASDGTITGPINLTNSSESDENASVAIDSQDVVHIVWEKGSTLGYANNASGSFALVNTGVTTRAEYPAVAVGPEDIVSIAYRVSRTNGILQMVDNSDGAFGLPIDVIPQGAYQPSLFQTMDLAIDGEGRRYLGLAVNSSSTPEGIFLAHEGESGFEVTEIVRNDGSNQNASVGVNEGSEIAVSYSISGFDSGAGVVFADLAVATRADGGCPADLDGDGDGDVFDLLDYLALWFVIDPAANLDDIPEIDVFDLLTYLSFWFAGCA